MPVSSPAWLKRQPSGPPGPPPPAEAVEAFKAFVDAESFPDALKWHAALLGHLDLSPGPFHEFYPKFKSALRDHLPFRYKEIFKILDARSKLKPYGSAPAEKPKRPRVATKSLTSTPPWLTVPLAHRRSQAALESFFHSSLCSAIAP